MTLNFSAGYSADVEILLQVAGVSHELSHTGPDFVRLRHIATLPAGPAELITRIDGIEDRDAIVLPKGVTPPDLHVRYVAARSEVPSTSR